MSKINELKTTIVDVYPELSTEEQAEVQETLREYLIVVRQIFNRLSGEKPDFLTDLGGRARLTEEQDRP